MLADLSMIAFRNCWSSFVALILVVPIALLPSALSAEQPNQAESTKKLIGWTERISISDSKLVLYGQMEPARQSTTLHLPPGSIEPGKSSQDRVSFKLSDRFGASHTFSLPIVRRTRLRSPSGQSRQVYVVTLSFCIAGRYIEEEVILSERSNINNEMFVGRQTLEGLFIVDPSQQFTSDPACSVSPSRKGE